MRLEKVEIPVYIGVYEFEQIEKQLIYTDLKIKFLEMPKGCLSDRLGDVVCYAELNSKLMEIASERRYRLIENLAYSLLKGVVRLLTSPSNVVLTVHKTPPIENLKKTSFTIEKKWLT